MSTTKRWGLHRLVIVVSMVEAADTKWIGSLQAACSTLV